MAQHWANVMAFSSQLNHQDLPSLIRQFPGWHTMAENILCEPASLGLVMRAMLQDVEFAYRVEVGTPVSAGLVRLNAYELANRASYTLLGTVPSKDLLDAAAAGHLDDAAGMRDTAQKLLLLQGAVERASRFHAQWLNYERPQVDPVLGASMRAESDALIAKILFEMKRPWSELFTFDQAFVDATVAPIYGLPAPGSPQWMKLTDMNRRGILGEASFLAGGAKFGDTSPVLRGLQIRSRLMCQYIPPPPPNVNVDKPPAGSPTDCKSTRYANHRANPCATSSISTACATSNFCIHAAAEQIQSGKVDLMLCGGAEAPITPVGLAGFTAIGTHSD